MKAIRTTLVVLLVLILGVLGSTWLAFYEDSYHSSRYAFLELCGSVADGYPDSEILSIPVSSSQSEGLFVDVF